MQGYSQLFRKGFRKREVSERQIVDPNVTEFSIHISSRLGFDTESFSNVSGSAFQIVYAPEVTSLTP